MLMNSVTRSILASRAARPLNHLIVSEFPKSGGTWVAQMVAHALDLPFPRNRRPGFRRAALHGHYLRGVDKQRTLVVFRDGRDVMVSWYYHCTYVNERNNAGLVDIVRRDLRFKDFADVRANLPEFIEYSFTRARHPRFSWSDFVAAWANQDCAASVRYEDMRASPTDELIRIVRGLGGVLGPEDAATIVHEFSFESLSGRRSGVERPSSFMRKGVVGDWRNHFNAEACSVFRSFAGDALVTLGYESDDSWAHRLSVLDSDTPMNRVDST